MKYIEISHTNMSTKITPKSGHVFPMRRLVVPIFGGTQSHPSHFLWLKTSPFLVVPSIYQHECEKPTTNVDHFNHFPRQTIEITTSAWFKTLNISLLRGNHHPASSTYFLGPHPSIVGLPVYEATQAVQVGPCCAESQWLTAIGLRELWNFESRCQGGALTRKTWDSMIFYEIQ